LNSSHIIESEKKITMAMPKPVFKTHVAANKYKKWNNLSENLILR